MHKRSEDRPGMCNSLLNLLKLLLILLVVSVVCSGCSKDLSRNEAEKIIVKSLAFPQPVLGEITFGPVLYHSTKNWNQLARLAKEGLITYSYQDMFKYRSEEIHLFTVSLTEEGKKYMVGNPWNSDLCDPLQSVFDPGGDKKYYAKKDRLEVWNIPNAGLESTGNKRIIGNLNQWDRLDVLETKGNWFRVKPTDYWPYGWRDGWVDGEYLVKPAPQQCEMVKVKLYDRTFLQVSGIQMKAGNKKAVVEFTWTNGNFTPFGKYMQEGENCMQREDMPKIPAPEAFSKTVCMALYDDGWRMVDSADCLF